MVILGPCLVLGGLYYRYRYVNTSLEPIWVLFGSLVVFNLEFLHCWSPMGLGRGGGSWWGMVEGVGRWGKRGGCKVVLHLVEVGLWMLEVFVGDDRVL